MTGRLFLVLLLFFCISCNNSSEELFSSLQHISSEEKAKLRFVAVLPAAGCTGCITDFESFFKQNIRLLDCGVLVLSEVKSKKEAKHRLGTEIFFHKNFTLYDKVFPLIKNEIYPKIFILKDGEIIETYVISPESKFKYTSVLRELCS
jgi:hypothetical protein